MKGKVGFTEDKMALLVGSLIFVLAGFNVLGVDLLGWAVKSNT